MPKKINIQVGLFLMLLLVLSSGGCGNSKDDKGKASTPAARKTRMETALKGPAGKKAESAVLGLLQKKHTAANHADADGEAKKELKTIRDGVFEYAKQETISSAEIDAVKEMAKMFFSGGSADPIAQKAAMDQLSTFINILLKAHGGLQQ